MILGQPRQLPLNTFPAWKYFMVVIVIALGAFLALPNLFGEDHAVQISDKNGSEIPKELIVNIEKAIKDEGIKIKSHELEGSRGLIRLVNSDDQNEAKRIAFQYIEGHDEESIKNNLIVAANLAAATPDWMADIGLSPMKLGLDLRGGVHFLLEVDMDNLFEKEQEKAVTTIKSELYDEKIYHEGVSATDQTTIIAKFKTEELQQEAFSKLNNQLQGFTINDREVNGEFQLVFHITDAKVREIKDFAIKQNITTLNNRINAIGVAEPLVQRQGSDRIVVQLPGIQDTASARSIIGDTRTLEFRMANDRRSVADAINGRVPYDSELLYETDGRPVLVYKKVMLDGEHVTGAGTSLDERGLPQINISLDSVGGSIMTKESSKNIGKRMAIVLTEVAPIFKKNEYGDFVKNEQGELIKIDEEINKEAVSVATIQSTLPDRFRITGSFTQQYASDLALILKSGSLKAPIYIVEDGTIGASLGQENVEKGLFSIVIGFVMVLAFMLVRYKVFGVVANLALLCNLVLIVGVMSLIGAVLTLPGMAGIVLTVGMAVDANVLIFERIREELKDGVSPAQAIHNGYDAAFSTIADANITTAIAALILFAIGTGPVAGFAITLLFGILTSMFTAIVGSRALINLIYGGKTVRKLAV
ncbi:protein translocase subunit SecD [Pleionea mediterranea]|uniref:Protein translocase subunit SecD n=1 Tax=Pleionea mediterranea TaxID=523701 RepID=A0A316FRK6_9GAMM|nr:protein translocase subunit SecD [Pleionea mediterranea]PWK50923.1 preprotein translocase subunit SecD [Pleionea mediterranea]